jgi:hypothetical protein
MDRLPQLPNFKTLTLESWRTADPIGKLFVPPIDPSRGEEVADAWARAFLEPKLSERVPGAVRQLFHVAQGVMVYGYYFYPLYTVGSEQLYRVLEAALLHKCAELNAPTKLRGFGKMLEWLAANNCRINLEVWNAVRHMRNSGSHPEIQSISTPGMALNDLDIALRLIEDLYADPLLDGDASSLEK